MPPGNHGRVNATADGALPWPARAVITREATHQVDSARGDFQRPYGDDEIRAKFRALAGTLFTARDVAELEVLVASIEDWRTVGSLLDLIGGYHTARR